MFYWTRTSFPFSVFDDGTSSHLLSAAGAASVETLCSTRVCLGCQRPHTNTHTHVLPASTCRLCIDHVPLSTMLLIYMHGRQQLSVSSVSYTCAVFSLSVSYVCKRTSFPFSVFDDGTSSHLLSAAAAGAASVETLCSTCVCFGCQRPHTNTHTCYRRAHVDCALITCPYPPRYSFL